MVMGTVIAYLLSRVPWVGAFLALCSLVTFAAVGLLKELREDLAQLFEQVT